MLNKNITLSQQKTKIRKMDVKEKRRQETKTQKILMKENFGIEEFDVVLFMRQKQRRKKRKERDKNKEAKESKRERQEGKEKRTRRRERQRKKHWKRGRPKKVRRNKGRHSKINKKMPFSGGKQGFFFRITKQRKEQKQTKKQKNNKEGGFRAKWGGPLGHLTWPLNPPKQKTK